MSRSHPGMRPEIAAKMSQIPTSNRTDPMSTPSLSPAGLAAMVRRIQPPTSDVHVP